MGEKFTDRAKEEVWYGGDVERRTVEDCGRLAGVNSIKDTWPSSSHRMQSGVLLLLRINGWGKNAWFQSFLLIYAI